MPFHPPPSCSRQPTSCLFNMRSIDSLFFSRARIRVYSYRKAESSRELSKARIGRRVERVRQSPAEIGEGTKPKIEAGDRASDRDSYLIDSVSRLPRRAASHRPVPRRSHISRTCSATSSRPRIPMTDFNGSGSFTNQPGSIAIRRFDDSL